MGTQGACICGFSVCFVLVRWEVTGMSSQIPEMTNHHTTKDQPNNLFIQLISIFVSYIQS